MNAIIIPVLLFSNFFGQISSPAQTNPIFNSKKGLEKSNPIYQKGQSRQALPQELPEPAGNVGPKETYAFPGMVGFQGGRKVVSENIFNLNLPIAVTVEVIKPQGKTIAIEEGVLTNFINRTLNEQGIQTGGQGTPLLHLLVFVNEVENIGFAYMGLRLLESVKMDRILLPKDFYFQAITWEKQDLIAASQQDLETEVQKSAQDLLKSFIERYQYFKGVQQRTKGTSP
ncbi:hypothetical protein BN1013_02200 [Candidatus Rubidus massiliensis]|nr:hypothetical protein BN1013_02200 [Candidatus Rubidus massiliensis]